MAVTLTGCGCADEDKQRRGEGWSGKEGGGTDMGELARALAVSLTWRARPGAFGRPHIRPRFGLNMGSAGQSGRLGQLWGARLGAIFLSGQ